MSKHPYLRLFIGSAAPDADFDETEGYEVGDVIIYSGIPYTAVDVSTGAAVWTTGGSSFDLAAAIHAAASAIPVSDDEYAIWQNASGELRKVTQFDLENAVVVGLSPLFVEWGADTDDDGDMTANSDDLIPTQKAVVTYVENKVTGLLDFKGNIDCSGNPNYPSAAKGDTYLVSVAGKIGGASGKSVDVGDTIVAKAVTAGGTEASVGTSWFILEHNLAGALLTTNNLSDLASASTARTNLGLGNAATKNTGTGSGDVATGDHQHTYSETLSSGLIGTTVPAASTRHSAPGKPLLDTALNNMPVLDAGTLSTLSVRTSTAQPGTGSLVCTLYVNSSPTSVVVTIAAGSGAGTYQDTTHTVSVSAGDIVRWEIVNNAPAAASANVTVIQTRHAKTTT